MCGVRVCVWCGVRVVVCVCGVFVCVCVCVLECVENAVFRTVFGAV